MRHDELNKLVRRKPFRPFNLDLVNGQTFYFDDPESFIITRGDLHTTDKDFELVLINLALVSTVRFHGETLSS